MKNDPLTLAKDLLLGAAVLVPCVSCRTNTPEERPNVVLFYIDDMGYADLGCYGQTRWATPNIDSLAAEGVRFTNAYSASAVSTPSRAGLLTGRYPARMGVQDVFYPDSYTGIPQEELLISELMKSEGYATGIIGKWHLGSRERYLPLQNGFDEYFGIPYSNDMSAQVYLRGNEVEEFHIDQSLMTRRYTEEAKSFIARRKNQPFFLYLAHNMMHVPIFCSEDFKGRSGAGIYGDAVMEVDWSVGQIVEELRKQGILENTLIIFASDNGPWLQEGPLGGEAFPLREGKHTTYEGGVRIPTLVYWKGKIAPAQRDDIICTLDWFPTLAHLCRLPVPENLRLDGYDLSDLLLHGGNRKSNTYAYFRTNKEASGLRIGDWKITLPQDRIKGNFWRASTAEHDTLLFNLKDDPSEKVNLFKKYPQKAHEMALALNDYKKNFGNIPPALVTTGNHQLEYLRNQRKEARDEAIAKGYRSKEEIINGFFEPD
ncbi:arylsulfatase [Bacteroidia bacterium]|nr:arylsulfatase [Bacteroidia bacterium]